MENDKNYRDGVVFKAVNGLWLSGLYAMWSGSGAGLVCGAGVGVLCPIVLCLIGVMNVARYGVESLLFSSFMTIVGGAIVGTAVGAIVGLLAGVLASGFGGQRGCRYGAALSALIVGIGIVLTTYYRLAGPHFSLWKNGAIDGMALLPWGLLLLLTAIGYGIGNYLYTCLEIRDGLFTRWRITLHQHGVDNLTTKERAIATAIAVAPVLFTYGYIAASVIPRTHRF